MFNYFFAIFFKVKEDVDYFKVVAEPGIYRDPLYHEQCLLLLQNTFRQVFISFNYAPFQC